MLSHKHAVHCRDEGERPVQETALKQDMHVELLSAFWNHWKREARQPNPPCLYAARRLHFYISVAHISFGRIQCLHICVYIHVYVHSYIYAQPYIDIYIHIHMYINTYTHIN